MTDHVAEIQRRLAANADLAAVAPPPVGRFAHDFVADQPTSAIAPALLDEVTAALRAGQTHYVDVPGLAALRERIAANLAAAGRATPDKAGVVVTAGVQEARFLAIQVLSETFDVVAVPDVVHPGVRTALGIRASAGRLELRTDAAQGYLVPVAEVERALAAGARLLVLESPVRLSGAAYDTASVRRIAELVAAHDAHVVLDDGFAPWATSPVASLALEAAAAGRVTLIGEVLPGAGLEAWSLGFIAGAAERTAGFTKLKQIMSICTSTPAQLAAIALDREGAGDVTGRRAALAAARAELLTAAAVAGLRVVPGHCAHVVAVAGVATTPVGALDGAAFGAPGTARLRVDDDGATQHALRPLAGGRGGAR
jgi:aspartate/methionine/tyrosine aminotransferase